MRAAVLAVVLVVPRRRIVAPRDGRRRHAALRVGLHAAMQGIAVRGELDQPRRLHLARLSPGDEVTARHPPVAAVGYRAAGLTLHPDADQRRHDRESVDLQQRKDARVEALVAVIEGDEDRLVGQRSRAARRSGQIVERHGRPAAAFQPVEELHQRRAGDGIGFEILDRGRRRRGRRSTRSAGRPAGCVGRPARQRARNTSRTSSQAHRPQILWRRPTTKRQRVLDRAIVDAAAQQDAIAELGQRIEAPAVLVVDRADPVVWEALLRSRGRHRLSAPAPGCCRSAATARARPAGRRSATGRGWDCSRAHCGRLLLEA